MPKPWNYAIGLGRTRGSVTLCMALPFTFKKYHDAKEEELWKTQIFHHAKI